MRRAGRFQAERDAARAALAELPDGDRILAFDAYRSRVLALPEAIAAASGARREELCRIVVERAVVRDRQLETIDWTPPARPFFERRQRGVPPRGFEPLVSTLKGWRPRPLDDGGDAGRV